VQQGQRQVEAALHAARVAADLPVRRVGEADAGDQLVAALGALGLGHPVEGALQAHVLTCGQVRVQGRLLERGADRVAHRGAFLDDVVAGDPGRTCCGGEESGEHVNGRRLAGAVRSEEAVDLAGPDLEVDAVDGADAALELADESMSFDSVGLRLASVPAWHPKSPSGIARVRTNGSIHRYLSLANVEPCRYPLSSEATMSEKGEEQRSFPGPGHWLAGEIGRTDPGSEAWSLMHWLMVANKQRLFAIAHEFDLAPQQMIALRMLGAGPRKMSELAQSLFCDNSNVTGIVDRLEERGLVTRESAEGDRRVKLLVLTKDGERMRLEITKRMAEPPPPIASLSEKDQRVLRDILKRATEGISDEDVEGQLRHQIAAASGRPT
jgi:DNA-binding MarR family transcriptional regulator